MIGMLAIAGVLIAYGAIGAGQASWRAWRERRDEQVAQVAHEGRRERLTEAEMRTAVRVQILETPEDRAARLAHHADCDEYIATVNARFDALVAGMPPHDNAPFDPSYWPAVEAPEYGPEVAHVDLVTLAEFEPAAVLARVERDNAVPAVFSWHTSELPIAERLVCTPAMLRPQRRRATLRRALGAPSQSLTF